MCFEAMLNIPKNSRTDWQKALRVLEKVIADFGDSAETYGFLGRVYKDRYKAGDEGDPARTGYLEKAIAAYTKGFEAEPMDYYPGVNAITLLALCLQSYARAAPSPATTGPSQPFWSWRWWEVIET